MTFSVCFAQLHQKVTIYVTSVITDQKYYDIQSQVVSLFKFQMDQQCIWRNVDNNRNRKGDDNHINCIENSSTITQVARGMNNYNDYQSTKTNLKSNDTVCH